LNKEYAQYFSGIKSVLFITAMNSLDHINTSYVNNRLKAPVCYFLGLKVTQNTFEQVYNQRSKLSACLSKLRFKTVNL